MGEQILVQQSEFIACAHSYTAKTHLLFGQLHLSPELQLLTRIVICGSQLWAIQHTWSTGTAEVATRAGKFANTSDKCCTQQKGHSLVTDKYA